jgi:hypothetical protein
MISLLTFILFFIFTLFYLDDFRLSENKYIRFTQTLAPLFLLLLIILFYSLNVLTFNEIAACSLDGDKNTSNTVNIGANVEVNKEAAEALGRNLGIAGTIAGVSGAVAKGLAKSSMPPLQKAGIIIGTGIAGGAIFVGTSAVNRVVNTTTTSSTTTTPTTSNLPDGVNKLLPGDGFSDLMVLILSIDVLTCVCLSLIIILSMILLFKI